MEECCYAKCHIVKIRVGLMERKYGLRPGAWTLPLELGQMRGANAAAALG